MKTLREMLRELVTVIVFVAGAFVAYEGNLAGVCICMIAVSVRIEALLRANVQPE